ncbi:MAG: hypothetical protein BYD32DRAFT_429762 [Podila humilis]|nr:MAG: hypothetical protein BYD32DRAFT_429762 [Podila humilis]
MWKLLSHHHLISFFHRSALDSTWLDLRNKSLACISKKDSITHHGEILTTRPDQESEPVWEIDRIRGTSSYSRQTPLLFPMQSRPHNHNGRCPHLRLCAQIKGGTFFQQIRPADLSLGMSG